VSLFLFGRKALVNLDLRQSIRACAHQHGFDLCHFARPNIAEKHTHALQHWVDAGMYADMHWMAEAERLQRRKQPNTMLDEVKTVISLAMRHAEPPYQLETAEQSHDRGVIAAYAHGVDYHEVMKKRLKALARDLDRLLGEHGQRVYVDTAPVLEHALAAAGGLAWQGKHSLSINRQQGSWFLLAELFTTADIPADEAATEHCGSCTACMDICPTQAIVAPYVVDANRCISYLTIEYKGFIPLIYRRAMGNRIYGCDDCQIICPWNQKAAPISHDHLAVRKENILPELASLLRLDAAAFREQFRKSPIKRTGRAAFLRNVCVAMGNAAASEFAAECINPLLNALHDDEALIRGHAVWALGEISQEHAIEGLFEKMHEMAKNEENNDVLKEIKAILSLK